MKTKDEIRKPPSDDELAHRWKDLYPSTIFAYGSFRRYENGSWRNMETSEVEREIYCILQKAENEGIQPCGPLINSVLQICSLLCLVLRPGTENHGIRQFLAACCETGTVYLVLPKDIWRSYCEWTIANGYKCQPEEELEIDLKLRGFSTKAFDGRIYLAGLKLKSERVAENE